MSLAFLFLSWLPIADSCAPAASRRGYNAKKRSEAAFISAQNGTFLIHGIVQPGPVIFTSTMHCVFTREVTQSHISLIHDLFSYCGIDIFFLQQMQSRRRNASKSILLLEVCVTFRPIFNFHIFEQVQMISRCPARTQVLPTSRNCSSRAACQIDIGMKSFLVAYPARAVGLEIRVGSKEFVILCAMPIGNWLGSVSLRAIQLLSFRRWRFR